MEEATSLSLQENIVCENCSTSNSYNQKFCSVCSFPISGTDDDKRHFRTSVGNRKLLLKDAKEKIKTAKTIIYILAGLMFLIGLYQGIGNEDFVTMILKAWYT